MKFLFVADPIEGFKPHKDSTLAMMSAAQKAGHEIYHGKVSGLNWRAGVVRMVCHQVKVDPSQRPWFEMLIEEDVPLKKFDAVFMRADPPFDSEYLANTWLLSQAERDGAKIFNSPTALREHSEKVSIAEFSEFTAPTIVTRSTEAIREFHREYQDIVIKPLDGMGGMGIFRVGTDGLNLASIVETLGDNGRRALMAQKYLPEIVDGDKRLLLIRGKPIPYVLARIPQAGDIRGNLAAGGKGEARPITPAELHIAHAIGSTLYERGLFLVGLDIIGDRLTEINVTSPTCFVEISEQTNFNVAKHWLNEVEMELLGK